MPLWLQKRLFTKKTYVCAPIISIWWPIFNLRGRTQICPLGEPFGTKRKEKRSQSKQGNSLCIHCSALFSSHDLHELWPHPAVDSFHTIPSLEHRSPIDFHRSFIYTTTLCRFHRKSLPQARCQPCPMEPPSHHIPRTKLRSRSNRQNTRERKGTRKNKTRKAMRKRTKTIPTTNT